MSKKNWKRLAVLSMAAALMVSQLGGTTPLVYAEETTSDTTSEKEITLDNGDFEDGNKTNWTITAGSAFSCNVKTNDSSNSSQFLNLWNGSSEANSITLEYQVSGLEAGTYYASVYMDGDATDSGLKLSASDENGNVLKQTASIETKGWNNWTTYTTDCFTLEGGTLILTIAGDNVPASYWGTLMT